MRSHQSSIYTLRLVVIGIISYLLIAALAGIYLTRLTENLVLYDFGVSLLSIGSALAFLGLLVFFSSALWAHQIRRYLPPDDQSLPVRDARSDFLLTFAISSLLVAVTGLLLIKNVVASGARNPTSGTYPHIGSVKVGLDYFQEQAQLWQEDAYLVGITIELADTSRYRIRAEYQSPSASSEALSLWLQSDGNISTHIYRLDVKPGRWRAIQDADWQIDSEDALRIFATKEEIRFCLMSSAQRANRLQLERLSLEDTQPVVWILFLPDCAETQENWYYLDAQTGEWRQRE